MNKDQFTLAYLDYAVKEHPLMYAQTVKAEAVKVWRALEDRGLVWNGTIKNPVKSIKEIRKKIAWPPPMEDVKVKKAPQKPVSHETKGR